MYILVNLRESIVSTSDDFYLNAWCTEIIDEINEALSPFNAKAVDHYLNHDGGEVIIDIEPETAYTMIMLNDHWLKSYIKQ